MYILYDQPQIKYAKKEIFKRMRESFFSVKEILVFMRSALEKFSSERAIFDSMKAEELLAHTAQLYLDWPELVIYIKTHAKDSLIEERKKQAA